MQNEPQLLEITLATEPLLAPPSPDVPSLNDPPSFDGYSTTSSQSGKSDSSLEEYLYQLGAQERKPLEDFALAQEVVQAQVASILDADGCVCSSCENFFRFSVPVSDQNRAPDSDQLSRLWHGSDAKKILVDVVIQNTIHAALLSYGHSNFVTRHPGPCAEYSASLGHRASESVSSSPSGLSGELVDVALSGRFQRIDIAQPWSATSSPDPGLVSAEVAERVPSADASAPATTARTTDDDFDFAREVLDQVRQKLADALQKGPRRHRRSPGDSKQARPRTMSLRKAVLSRARPRIAPPASLKTT